MPTSNNSGGKNPPNNPTNKKVVKEVPIVTKSKSGMGSCPVDSTTCRTSPYGDNWRTGSTKEANSSSQSWDNKNWVSGSAPRGVKDPYRAEFASDQIILDDPSMIQDVLTTQKTLIKGYGIAICEGSNQKFRDMLNKHLAELAEDQFDSFKYMQDRNLYPVEPAPEKKLTQAKERFKSKEETMNATRPKR
ncbi:MAG: spore coat protein [Firmicutes bacterium]|nr:spore coat protein [Bacillota bacterium]